MKGVVIIQLTKRQEEIITIVKNQEPITGELIAESLQVTRAALRSDLVVLTMLGILDAKPKVGYCYIGQSQALKAANPFQETRVSDVMGVPLTVHQDISVYDVIVHIFMEDAGCAFIVDEQDYLCGVVSRKDLLKASIGSNDLTKVPVGMIMTRMPNIATVETGASLFTAAERLVTRQVDSLPVVQQDKSQAGKFKVVGKLSKTILSKLFLEIRE